MGNNCNKFSELVNANKRKFSNEHIYRINDNNYLFEGFPRGRSVNSPIWYSTKEGIKFYNQTRNNSTQIDFILNTGNYYFINFADNEDNLNFDLLFRFMSFLNVSGEIKNLFDNDERKSILELDRELFEKFIKKLEECQINDICGFYLGMSKYFYNEYSPHIFYPEYILIANKQREILTQTNLELDSIKFEPPPPSSKKRKRMPEEEDKNNKKKVVIN